LKIVATSETLLGILAGGRHGKPAEPVLLSGDVTTGSADMIQRILENPMTGTMLSKLWTEQGKNLILHGKISSTYSKSAEATLVVRHAQPISTVLSVLRVRAIQVFVIVPTPVTFLMVLIILWSHSLVVVVARKEVLRGEAVEVLERWRKKRAPLFETEGWPIMLPGVPTI
jgi:hypothetical protein